VNNRKILHLDNWGKGLLISIISRAVNDDKTLNVDDLGKLKEIKKQLQESVSPVDFNQYTTTDS
jgi:hypothetical protein